MSFGIRQIPVGVSASIQCRNLLRTAYVRSFCTALLLQGKRLLQVGKMAENESMDHLKIADNELKSVATGDMVKLETFWTDQTCVIYFLRRFGCMFCRTSAKDVSALKPALDAQNVRLVGVGLEELGVEEFVQGNFWAGDLFVDLGQKCYKDLQYNRTSFLGLIPSLIARKGRDAISKGRQEKVGGNLQGDGYQSGGLIIVSAGGEKTLFSWKQSDPTDTFDPQLISKTLNLSEHAQEAAEQMQ